jgi:hypothetical protein
MIAILMMIQQMRECRTFWIEKVLLPRGLHFDFFSESSELYSLCGKSLGRDSFVDDKGEGEGKGFRCRGARNDPITLPEIFVICSVMLALSLISALGIVTCGSISLVLSITLVCRNEAEPKKWRRCIRGADLIGEKL